MSIAHVSSSSTIGTSSTHLDVAGIASEIQRSEAESLTPHNVSVSSYHHGPHPPTLAPSYLVLKVGVGFATEQQLRAVVMPVSACQQKRRITVLDARGLHRP